LPGLLLRLRNNSAIPFRFRAVEAPAWFAVAGGELKEEKALGVAIRVGKEAPAGSHQIELGLEITNFHVGPGRNLRVRVPLRLEVAKSVQ